MRKLLFKLILFGGIGFALLLTYIFGFTNGTKFAAANYNPEINKIKQIDEDRLWEVVNEWREKQGKSLYKTDIVLCGYANERVKKIQSDWSHDGFHTLKKVDQFTTLGENILNDFDNEETGLNSWLNSTTHKANLDENFSHSCIRCENNYCVQLFGKY